MTPAAKTADRPLVIIVDDDAAVRSALEEVLLSVGIKVGAFGSTEELASARLHQPPGCFILDVRLPGMSGLDFHRYISRDETAPPVVFMTGHADIRMCVEAMKAGAVDFLTKPFRDQELLDAVTAALRRANETRRLIEEAEALADRFAQLSPRERQVMSLVTSGRMNKQVAGDLSISEVTAKLHRSAAMRKMGAHSFAELVRMASTLGLDTDTNRSPDDGRAVDLSGAS